MAQTNSTIIHQMGLYAHPIYNGNWPQLVIDRVGSRSTYEGFTKSRLPEFTEEEIEYIKGTSDFFCLNTYGTYYSHYQYDVDQLIGLPNYYLDIGVGTSSDPEWKSAVDWVAMVPWGFRNLLNYVWNEYTPSEIIITENGWADVSSILEDSDRIDYIEVRKIEQSSVT